MLQVVGQLCDLLSLADWVGPVALILVDVGFVVMLATARVQSHPLVERREAAEEMPGCWELALGEALQSLKNGALPHLTWARALLGAAAAFLLLFGTAGMYVVLREGAVVEDAKQRLAVLGPDRAR